MESVLLQVMVGGKPEPQGSVKAFVPTLKSGQPVRRPDGGIVVNLTSDNPALKAWRETVAAAARETGCEPREDIGVRVDVTFFLKRPEAHVGTGRNAGVVKDSAPAFPLVRPDVDKLLRAILDALTDVVFKDDSQVVELVGRKRYAEPGANVGASIVVWVLEQQRAVDLSSQLALA